MGPVSYTHLDVYKRQFQKSIKNKRSLANCSIDKNVSDEKFPVRRHLLKGGRGRAIKMHRTSNEDDYKDDVTDRQ